MTTDLGKLFHEANLLMALISEDTLSVERIRDARITRFLIHKVRYVQGAKGKISRRQHRKNTGSKEFKKVNWLPTKERVEQQVATKRALYHSLMNFFFPSSYV